MNGQKSSYISVIYDEKRTPKTEYPAQLTQYLTERFFLKPGTTLLELGAGRGDFLLGFKKLGFRTIAIDREISSDIRLIADESYVCDLAKDSLPLPDVSIDVVYHKSVLEHLHDPYHLMEESMRVLKPGGVLIVMTPDWVSGLSVFFEDFSHVHPYTHEAVRDLLLFYQLEVLVAERFRQLPVTWKSIILGALSSITGTCLTTRFARKLTESTGIKFFRWSTELMVLAVGRKPL